MLSPLLVLSIVLIAGAAAGALSKRLHLPSVTGQILAGILLGPVGHLFSAEDLHGLRPMTHFALGLMAVEVGSHLVLVRLRNAKRRLALLTVLEATLTPALVYAAVLAAGGQAPFALLLAALAVSTAPATTLALVKETRAKGVFVKTLVAGVALNNIACLCLFELARSLARAMLVPGRGDGVLDLIAAPARQLALAIGLGAGIGVALVLMTRRTLRADRLTTASIIAILLTAGLADALGTSTLLACLFLGVALANLTSDRDEVGHAVFENFDSALMAVFFTLAGAELEFEHLLLAGVLALLVFTARAVGKVAAAHLAMRLSGATARLRRFLGLALVPQAGLAVGLMLLVTEDREFAPIRDLFLAVVLSVVLLNELVGPILARVALRYSGDFQKDRARLIDFLHEENIVTDLVAQTKEEAITRLTDVLIATNHLRVDRAALLASILERERQYSTCIGDGLAVPHGILAQGSELVGAMGISRHGLRFATPDGQPVHVMLLLATPDEQRTRHLEVLAAIARVVGSDRVVRRQLFRAKSPAHAYEVLHAEEGAEDFNYFLEG